VSADHQLAGAEVSVGNDPIAMQSLQSLGLSIERLSTAEQVARQLRPEILSGSLRPGTPLREAALARAMTVSRNTMREALRILSREGLAVHLHHRGVVVAILTPADVVDIYRARRLLELTALGTGDVHQNTFADIEQTLGRLADAVSCEDWEDAVEADLAFHRHLVARAGSDRLNTFFAMLQMEMRYCLALVIRERWRSAGKAYVQEHRDLYEAAVRGDLDRAREILSQSMVESQELIMRLLESHRDGYNGGVNSEQQG
jgi:DNA-binding GntR family transcriptional regulator